MTRVTVVGLAPYPVCITDGRSIEPGEIAEVENDQRVHNAVQAHSLGLVTIPPKEEVVPAEAPTQDAEKRPARKQRTLSSKDSQETE